MLPMQTRKQVGWRLYYGDGSTYCSKDGSWAKAPIDDVQILMYYFDDKKKEIVTGIDYYVNRVVESELRTEDKVCPCIVKFGKWTSRDNIDKINKEALASAWQ